MHNVPIERERTRVISTTRSRIAVTLAVLVLAGLGWLGRPLDARRLVQPRSALTFTDRNGTPLGTIYTRDDEASVAVPLARISPSFVRAVLATEDSRFGSHPGVDPLALARAAAQLVEFRSPRSGGSTLAMQLARIAYRLPRDLRGKLAEMVLALRLSAGSPPDAILEAYCNRAPMGSDLVGVEAAARTYFGVPASDLDLAQAALLAALPNDPARLDPYRHPAAAETRRRYVLARMLATGAVGRDAAERAERERVVLVPRARGILAAGHFLFALAPTIAPSVSRVRTTLDGPLQRFVEAQVRAVPRVLAERNVHDAAAVVLDNRSGEILAYAGSPDYFAERDGRVDGVRALRQPGSSLKPFLYELALERRTIRPTTILLDAPVTYALPGAHLYQPHDYGERYAGPVRTRIALANSLNVPAVRVLERVGVETFLERLRALGFEHLHRSAAYYGLGLALGSGEVSLLELARAYAAVANQRSLADGSSVGNPASWALVTDILADRFARARAFGVDSILRTPFAAAVKTGTSSDFRDTWTVGFSRDYTVAAWAGNFDGSPMRRVSGVSGAGPLWSAIMMRLHERREPAAFAPPAGYVRRSICAESGLRPTAACATIVQEWLDRADLAAYAAPLSRAAAALRIENPRDGDRYAYFARSGAAQRIAFRASGGRGRSVAWTLNGVPLARGGGEILWALRPGRFLLTATDGERIAHVAFAVEPRAEAVARGPRGFTVTYPR